MLKRILIGCLLGISSQHAYSQTVQVIRATQLEVSIRDGADFYPGAWRISPEVRPDTYETAVSGTKKLTFITDIDSISFVAAPDRTYDFVILVNGKDSAFTRIKTHLFTEPAVFYKGYIKSHDKKTSIEIPEVYELINIIFALTPTGERDENIVQHDIPYARDVLRYFHVYKNESCVREIDSLLRSGKYFSLKMDAYAFEFNAQNKIVQSSTYDRVSWGSTNSLRPYIPLVNDFSEKSGFRKFYREHRSLYDAQIKCYRDTLQIGEMQKWLNGNFPATRYNAFKIIFSPLVSWNQSANWFQNNGFKEAQAHVNFPYPYGNWLNGLTKAGANIKKGNIVFTELNHAFINPEGEKKIYQAGIVQSFRDLTKWEKAGTPAVSYGNAYRCFNEYMNWALVSLRYVDYAPASEQEKLILQNDKYMTEGRGFTKFSAFDQYLVALYKNRSKGKTIADLFPEIIQWFQSH